MNFLEQFKNEPAYRLATGRCPFCNKTATAEPGHFLCGTIYSGGTLQEVGDKCSERWKFSIASKRRR